jgi:AcrR family transcriptional regulator
MAKKPAVAVKRGPGDGSGREALLEATIEVVGQKGLRGLTFRAVGEAAGVNNSLIAHYFGTRDALLEAALNRAVRESIDVSHLATFATDRDGFIQAFADFAASESPREVFVYEMLLASRHRPEIAERVAELYQIYIQTMSASLKSVLGDSFTDAKARYVFGALDGLLLQRYTGADSEQIRAAVGQLWDDVLA